MFIYRRVFVGAAAAAWVFRTAKPAAQRAWVRRLHECLGAHFRGICLGLVSYSTLGLGESSSPRRHLNIVALAYPQRSRSALYCSWQDARRTRGKEIHHSPRTRRQTSGLQNS